jgi:hypothetical protein
MAFNSLNFDEAAEGKEHLCHSRLVTKSFFLFMSKKHLGAMLGVA